MRFSITIIFLLALTTHLAAESGAASKRLPTRTDRKLLIAHRGASGYAPEHTLAAYELAIQQKADFVECDLQMTKDGELICVHDADLARTTNVAEVFPDRATWRDPNGSGIPQRGWYAADLTLAEIKQLDAGSWFNRANPFAARKEYVGQRVLTLPEAIKAIGGRAGLYVETKHVPFYDSLGHDMVGKLVAVLDTHGFPKSRPSDRLYIESFTKASLVRLRAIAPHYTRIQLLPMEDKERRKDSAKVTAALATEVGAYAHGVGPDKGMLTSAADVALFHAAGLLVHPYTFRGATTAAKRRPLDNVEANGQSLRQNILAEIRRFINYGIDGGFTDYPDLWMEAR